jgi:hypothetical protein
MKRKKIYKNFHERFLPWDKQNPVSRNSTTRKCALRLKIILNSPRGKLQEISPLGPGWNSVVFNGRFIYDLAPKSSASSFFGVGSIKIRVSYLQNLRL